MSRYTTPLKHKISAYDSNDLHKLLPNLMPEPRKAPVLHTLIEMVIIGIGIISAVVGTIQHWPH